MTALDGAGFGLRRPRRGPRNLFVAGFIGSPAMNFLPGTLEEGRLRTAQELEELAADAGTGDAPGGADQVVARLDPASRAHEGQRLQLWFDPHKLHLFNPDNGAHLTL